MTGYTIVRGPIEETLTGRRKACYEIYYRGDLVAQFSYTPGNYASRSYALAKANAWVKARATTDDDGV